MFHIGGFLAGENILGHPLSDHGRELESMTTETCRAVEAPVHWQVSKNGMIVRRIIVDACPVATWNGASKCWKTVLSHCAEIGNLLFREPLCIVVGIALQQHIFGGANESDTAKIRA